MSIIALILLVALLIPILGIVVDSPIGRALARRLEGPQATPPVLTELVKKVELLQDENAFLQRLLEDPSQRPTLPPAKNP
jgi:uncharacterized SAM-binding protein YcdF (DUF218 family)